MWVVTLCKLGNDISYLGIDIRRNRIYRCRSHPLGGNSAPHQEMATLCADGSGDHLRTEGAKVAVTSRTVSKCESVVKGTEARGGEAIAIRCDVRAVTTLMQR